MTEEEAVQIRVIRQQLARLKQQIPALFDRAHESLHGEKAMDVLMFVEHELLRMTESMLWTVKPKTIPERKPDATD